MTTDRQFLFEYRFGGATYGVTLWAANPTEAKEKIKAMSLARYEGEVFETIHVSLSALWTVPRLIARWCNRRRTP